MAKNDHAHAMKLVESIRQHAGNDEAQRFEEKYPLSKTADVEKKYQWAKNICSDLESRFDTSTIIDIRKACRCNDGKSIASKLSKYLNKADSMQAFVEDFNQHETFASMEYLSENRIRFCYPQCYCACVKRAAGQVPKTWCYCTLGNAEAIFKAVLQREDIKLTLLESIKTGGQRCVIEVEWQ